MATLLNNMNKRQKYNREILKALQEIVETIPDWRFQQILQNIGIADGTDKFFEESRETYFNLQNNKIYQRLMEKSVH